MTSTPPTPDPHDAEDAWDPREELLALVGSLRVAVERQARAGRWGAPATATLRPVAVADARRELSDEPARLPEPPDEAELEDGARPRPTLASVRAELGDCQRCKLAATRTKLVFGAGAEDAALMFVGEAPGAEEDRTGEPFVGRAGELLDKMIEAMGWSRRTVYIANLLKCRPPNNRDPAPDEASECRPFLVAQLGAIAPRIVVALGRPAANALLGMDAPIGALRGKFHERLGVKIMPTFHPAYLLREPGRKRDAWSDLKLVMAELERIGVHARA
ncbi:MAG: uracil-DNA glycosylase [Kofleriaceae bacterium]